MEKPLVHNILEKEHSIWKTLVVSVQPRRGSSHRATLLSAVCKNSKETSADLEVYKCSFHSPQAALTTLHGHSYAGFVSYQALVLFVVPTINGYMLQPSYDGVFSYLAAMRVSTRCRQELKGTSRGTRGRRPRDLGSSEASGSPWGVLMYV